jgi:hypothetical protein
MLNSSPHSRSNTTPPITQHRTGSRSGPPFGANGHRRTASACLKGTKDGNHRFVRSPPGRRRLRFTSAANRAHPASPPLARITLLNSRGGTSSEARYSRALTQRLFWRESAPGNAASISMRIGLVFFRRGIDSSCAINQADRLATPRSFHRMYTW